jgi:hypothetical protein
MLCENETNIKNLLYKWNIFEYLKPILISLYNKIKITIEEYNSVSFFNDKIKIYVSHDIVDGKYFCLIRLFDISEIPVVNIAYTCILKDFFNMNEVILFRDFSCFEGLKYFLLSLSFINNKIQSPDSTSLFDLIVAVSNSFELLKKLMESSFSDIILLTLNDQRDIYFLSTLVILNYFNFNWNKKINEEIISITKSVLYFSLFYVKSPLFQKGDISFCLEKLESYCLTFFLIIES